MNGVSPVFAIDRETVEPHDQDFRRALELLQLGIAE
jgi:hypothetical protein